MDKSPTSISLDPNYNYQASYPNPPQQPRQFIPSSPNTYNDRPGQQGYSSYPEGSLQPPSQQSRQRHSSRSPHAGTVPFPEPQRGGSASHPQAYFPPSQTTQNLTVPGPTHYQHERRGSHGHSPARSSFDSQRLYPAGASSDTGGGSTFYSQQPGVQSHHGGGYDATAAQPQDWNAAVHEGSQGRGPWPITPGVPPVSGHRQPRPQVENDAVYNEGHDSRPKAPPSRPVNTSNPLCRYPRCTNPVFFDRRINEVREWCSDQHMQSAIRHNVERPCTTCNVWPRRNGRRHCSDICRQSQAQ